MQSKHLTIKDWQIDDRPREKMIKKGVRSLSNAELLAILIRTGTKKQSAVDLARSLLDNVQGNLNKLAQLDVESLKNIKGLGEAKAVTIIAALELGRRRQLEDYLKQPQFTNSNDVYQFFKSLIADSTQEEAWFITINNANKLIGYYALSIGGKTSTVIDIRLILKKAITDEATGIILAHNHPSGNIMPSESDKEITKKLYNACKTLEIRLLDHLIVTQNEYFSFADHGLLQ